MSTTPEKPTHAGLIRESSSDYPTIGETVKDAGGNAYIITSRSPEHFGADSRFGSVDVLLNQQHAPVQFVGNLPMVRCIAKLSEVGEQLAAMQARVALTQKNEAEIGGDWFGVQIADGPTLETTGLPPHPGDLIRATQAARDEASAFELRLQDNERRRQSGLPTYEL